MPYLDTCNRCLTADSPAITPVKITPSGPGAIVATIVARIFTSGLLARNGDATLATGPEAE